MQDAFLKLWERWDRIHTIDDPTGYLFRGRAQRVPDASSVMPPWRSGSPPRRPSIATSSGTRRCVPTCASCCLRSPHDSAPPSCSSTCWSTPPTRRRASSVSARPRSGPWPPRRDKPCERRRGCGMPDVNQLFRAATQHARPAPGALGAPTRSATPAGPQPQDERVGCRGGDRGGDRVVRRERAEPRQGRIGAGNAAPGGSGPDVHGRRNGRSRPIDRSRSPSAPLHSDVSPDGTRVAFAIEDRTRFADRHDAPGRNAAPHPHERFPRRGSAAMVAGREPAVVLRRE